jgi:molybdopterin biosynthesis enzyme
MRVVERKGTAFPVERQGSNMISSLMKADGLVVVPPGEEWIQEGARIRFMRLRWRLL